MSGRGKRNWKDPAETFSLPLQLSLPEENVTVEGVEESTLSVIIPAHKLSRDKLYSYLDFLELVYNTPAWLHIYKTGTARVSVTTTFPKSYIGFKVAGWLYKVSWTIYKKTPRGRP